MDEQDRKARVARNRELDELSTAISRLSDDQTMRALGYLVGWLEGALDDPRTAGGARFAIDGMKQAVAGVLVTTGAAVDPWQPGESPDVRPGAAADKQEAGVAP